MSGPSTFLPDSSCIVSLLCGWHENHVRTRAELERRFVSGEEMILAGPALAETYAVLTRFPPPYRLSPAAARDLIEANLLEGGFRIVTLDGEAYRELLRAAPARNIAGSTIHDAVILACAEAAGAGTVLTFNARHFRLFAGPKIEVAVPP